MNILKSLLVALLVVIATTSMMAHQPSDPSATTISSNVSLTKMIFIHGIVKGTGEAEGLVGATVEYDGKRYYTDLDGKFTITLPTDRPSHTILVSQISYTPKSVVVEPQNSGSLIVEINQ